LWVRNDAHATTLVFVDDNNARRPISKMPAILLAPHQAFLQAGLDPATLGESPGEKPFLSFPNTVAGPGARYATWLVQVPETYDGGNLSAIIWYSGGTASTNPIYCTTDIERMTVGESANNTNTTNKVWSTIPGPAVAFDFVSATQTLANADLDGAQPGDWIRIVFGRDPDNAADTYAGDLYVLGIQLREP
jgi:hypothetical protein